MTKSSAGSDDGNTNTTCSIPTAQTRYWTRFPSDLYLISLTEALHDEVWGDEFVDCVSPLLARLPRLPGYWLDQLMSEELNTTCSMQVELFHSLCSATLQRISETC